MESREGVKRALVLILAFAVAVCVGPVLFEEKLIYFPSDDFDVTPASLGLRHEEVRLVTSDGTTLDAWFLPAPGETAQGLTVLVCHGNAGNISHRLDRAVSMHANLGTDVLLFDYRGFGRSEGSPDEEGTYRDARAAYRYLVDERGVAADRLVLFGESLGAAVALQLATELPAAALVLEAPFTSIRDMAKEAYPFLPLTGWIRTRYDNMEKVPSLRMPLLVIHGKDDEVVPFEQGRTLFHAAPEPKAFLSIDRAGHSDAFLVAGENYWREWRALLSTLEAGC